MNSMAHKRKTNEKKQSAPYTIKDALEITDEIFKLSKDKDYNVGAFVHGLIFALEYAQVSYSIPQQQIAGIKRDCRQYFKNIDTMKK
jgi:hypothetical protein